ncbi:hypothetical protein N7456_010059 [Penicillium angulare]|uniref:Uncharacterized protein n=1 Tax=Penicillium angulare TaxID=116970 RepID=A0A9W9K5T0_9EURO|nr:hypothetical protein N7456_010059 [Penicillium angulare]
MLAQHATLQPLNGHLRSKGNSPGFQTLHGAHSLGDATIRHRMRYTLGQAHPQLAHVEPR